MDEDQGEGARGEEGDAGPQEGPDRREGTARLEEEEGRHALALKVPDRASSGVDEECTETGTFTQSILKG